MRGTCNTCPQPSIRWQRECGGLHPLVAVPLIIHVPQRRPSSMTAIRNGFQDRLPSPTHKPVAWPFAPDCPDPHCGGPHMAHRTAIHAPPASPGTTLGRTAEMEEHGKLGPTTTERGETRVAAGQPSRDLPEDR